MTDEVKKDDLIIGDIYYTEEGRKVILVDKHHLTYGYSVRSIGSGKTRYEKKLYTNLERVKS